MGTIVVTGAAGFIGSAFVRKLNDERVSDIVVVDDLGNSDKWKNLLGKRFRTFLPKDEFLALLRKGDIPFSVSAVVHLGACSDTTERNVDFLYQNNVAYSQELAAYCVENDIRFIYASSAATYGAGDDGYSDDESALLNLKPLNPYGFSKYLFDVWLAEQGWLHRCVGVKFFNVYGPNEYHKGFTASLVSKAVLQIRESGSLQLFRSHRKDFADGEQKRDFIYVKDCCDALWWMLNNPNVNGIFNLGSGQARSWKDLANAIFAAMDLKPNITYVDMPDSIRNQYQYFTEAPMGKLRSAGFTAPFRTLELAVDDYVRGYLHPNLRYW
jgi:ADP-L-glycero-D-manno-heptose 6-epimerase